MRRIDTDRWLCALPDIGVDPAELELIVLDLDGTLAELSVDWEAVRQTIATFASRLAGEPVMFRSLTKGLFWVRERFGDAAWREALFLVEKAEVDAAVRASLREDVIALVRTLSGPPLAVFTGNSRAAARIVGRATDLERAIRWIVSREDGFPPKPSPEGLLAILEWSGADSGRVLFIGNSEEDRLAGRGAGVPTLIVGGE